MCTEATAWAGQDGYSSKCDYSEQVHHVTAERGSNATATQEATFASFTKHSRAKRVSWGLCTFHVRHLDGFIIAEGSLPLPSFVHLVLQAAVYHTKLHLEHRFHFQVCTHAPLD